MRVVSALPHRSFLVALVLGGAVGLLTLGIGGRLSMRSIALLQGQAPGFSIGGSMTVVGLGAVTGAIVYGLWCRWFVARWAVRGS